MSEAKKQVFALNLREDNPLEKQMADFLKATPDNKKKVILAFLTHGASLLGKHMDESDSPTCNGVFFNRVVFSEVLRMGNSIESASVEQGRSVPQPEPVKGGDAKVIKRLQGLTS